MIGGEVEPVRHLDPVFKTLAPGRGDIRIERNCPCVLGFDSYRSAIYETQSVEAHPRSRDCCPRNCRVCWLQTSESSSRF